MRYKLNKKYIVFNILLRVVNSKLTLFENYLKFNVLYIYIT